MAGSLLFNLLYRHRSFDEALKVIQRAARAFGKLPDTHPEAAMEKARALRNLAEVQRVSGSLRQQARAVASARLAVEALKADEATMSESEAMFKAQCLTTLATCLDESGALVEAVACDEESLRLRRILYGEGRTVYQADYAYGHYQLAIRKHRTGDNGATRTAAAEAVVHYEAALPNGPERIAAFLAESLAILAGMELASDKPAKAIELLVRAISVLRPHYQRSADLWFPNLLPLCTKYVEACGAAGIQYNKSLVEDVIRQAMADASRGTGS